MPRGYAKGVVPRGHAEMKIVKLIELVERAGGRFKLVNRVVGLGWPERMNTTKRRRTVKLDREVRKNVYLVTAELRERACSRWWEANFACHCPAYRFAHRAHKPVDIWKALRGEEKLWIEPEHELDKQFQSAIEFDDYLEARCRKSSVKG